MAKLHKLVTLTTACRDRMADMGKDLLAHNSVIDLLKDDPALYQEVLSAAWKRRRRGDSLPNAE